MMMKIDPLMSPCEVISSYVPFILFQSSFLTLASIGLVADQQELACLPILRIKSPLRISYSM